MNLVATYSNLYVPVFGHDRHNLGQSKELDHDVLEQLAQYTTKNIVPIEVDNKVAHYFSV